MPPAPQPTHSPTAAAVPPQPGDLCAAPAAHPHVVLATLRALLQRVVDEVAHILLVLGLGHPGGVHVDGHGRAVAVVRLRVGRGAGGTCGGAAGSAAPGASASMRAPAGCWCAWRGLLPRPPAPLPPGTAPRPPASHRMPEPPRLPLSLTTLPLCTPATTTTTHPSPPTQSPAHRVKVDLEQGVHVAARVHGIGVHGILGGLQHPHRHLPQARVALRLRREEAWAGRGDQKRRRGGSRRIQAGRQAARPALTAPSTAVHAARWIASRRSMPQPPPVPPPPPACTRRP